MTNQKHTTNPTGIREIPKSSVALRIDRTNTGEIDRLTLESLDLAPLGLPSTARIGVIGKARFTERVFDGGTVLNRKPIVGESLDGIDKTHPFQVRVIVYGEDDQRILASCERLSVYEADEGTLQSLLPVEPVDLGEKLWRISAADGERPVLLVHNDPDIGMLERVRHDSLLQALILPEAIRRCLEHLLRDPPDGEDDDSAWKGRWLRFLKGVAVSLPDVTEDGEDVTIVHGAWLEATMDAISVRLKFKTKALAMLPRGQE